MTITQKTIDEKIEWQFEMYEADLKRKEYWRFQSDCFEKMSGVITALLHFGLINESRYHELWERAVRIFHKLGVVYNN